MATTGPMADFAKLPTRQKVLVFVVLGLMLGLLYYRFLYKPLTVKIADAKGVHVSQIARFKTNTENIKNYVVLRDAMVELQNRLEGNQKALPTEAEVPAFFDTLERKVRESGVEIVRWTKKPEEPVDQFVKVPVDIELSGTFLQLKRFFASLVQSDVDTMRAPISPIAPTPTPLNPDGTPAPATLPPLPVTPEPRKGPERERIVSIENLNLSKPDVRNREIYLTARFTAVTFRKEDALVPAPGAAAGAAVAPGAPGAATAPGSPASPALPSANTPAGARTRVEGAMQKDEARTRGGEGSAARLGGGL